MARWWFETAVTRAQSRGACCAAQAHASGSLRGQEADVTARSPGTNGEPPLGTPKEASRGSPLTGRSTGDSRHDRALEAELLQGRVAWLLSYAVADELLRSRECLGCGHLDVRLDADAFPVRASDRVDRPGERHANH